MPKQSLLAMKLAFRLQAGSVLVGMIASYIAVQVLGVVIFAGQAQASTTIQLTTQPATQITQQTAALHAFSNDASNTVGATYSFDIGTTTSYGMSVAALLTGDVTYKTQFGGSGSGNGQFSGIAGIAFDSQGNMYVADYYNQRIQKFNASGVYVTQWGSFGTANGQFKYIRGVAIDGSDNVYTIEQDGQRIQKFDSNGTYLAQWQPVIDGGMGEVAIPFGIAIDSNNNVFISEHASARYLVQKFDTAGTFITQWGVQGSGDGEFDSNAGIATDSAGNVYVADAANYRIQKFTNAGSYLAQWGVQGSGDGEFNAPFGVAVDSANHVYVSDAFNNRVQKFTSSGTYLGQFGSAGSGSGDFTMPLTIATNPQGEVYVADNNQLIQWFTGLTAGAPVDLACGSSYHFRAKAVSGSDTVYGADQSFSTLACDAALQITTSSLPDGTVGVDYRQTITTDSAQSVTITKLSGSLPPGISLSTSGVINGKPTRAGGYDFTVKADDGSASDTADLTIIIQPADTTDEGPTVTVQPPINDPLTLIPAEQRPTSNLTTTQPDAQPKNALLALARRIPVPVALGLPWILLLIALILVLIQYYQVHDEAQAAQQAQAIVDHQKLLVDEQNNFVALTTHYLHTPLSVMEGEIALMIKAGTLTQAQATKLLDTLSSLQSQVESVLAEEEPNEASN